MQQSTKLYCLVALIFALSLSTRLYFAFQIPTFTGGDAYFTLRQTEHIRATGTPLFNDELSFGGRYYVFPPLYYYVLAFFNLFIPITIVGKVIPNVLASTVVITTYLLAEHITKNKTSAVFAAVLAAFIPIYMSATTNSISPYALVLPLMMYMMYCFFNISEKRYLYQYLVCLLILILTHHSVILWLIGLLIYLLLLKLENLPQDKKEIEVIVFSLFLFIWLQLVIFKKMYLFHGFSVIWQNIPLSILSNYFANTSVLSMITQIGTLPLLYGMYAISRYLFTVRNRKINLLIGFTIGVGLLIWLKFIQPAAGLMTLGIVMTVLFSLFHQHTFDYIKKTRFDKYHNLFFAMFLVTISSTSIVPALYHTRGEIGAAVPEESIKAMAWLRDNADPASTVLSTPNEGHVVAAVSGLRDVIDTNYLLMSNTNQRYEDIREIYNARYETRAIKLLNKYTVAYILFTKGARQEYGVETLRFVDDEQCFRRVFAEETTEVYQSLCKI